MASKKAEDKGWGDGSVECFEDKQEGLSLIPSNHMGGQMW